MKQNNLTNKFHNVINAHYLIFIHRIFIDEKVKKGGFDRIIDIFKQSNIDVQLIESALYGRRCRVQSTCFQVSQSQKKKCINFVTPSAIFSRIVEVLIAIILAKKYKQNLVSAIFGVNPINFITGYIWKIVYRSKARMIFHAIDYSDKRFSNKLLNLLYKRMYLFSLKRADVVFCVTQRMLDRFIEMVPNGNYLYLPNNVNIEQVKKIKLKQVHKRDKFIVGCVSYIYSGFDWQAIVDASALLKDLEVEFWIVGDGPELNKFKNTVCLNGLDEIYRFFGHLEYEESLKKIASFNLGIAIYNGSASFNFYGDSIKIREYAAFGMPILCNPLTSTANEGEAYGACLIVNNPQEIADSIKLLLVKTDLRDRMSASATAWSQKYDNRRKLQEYGFII